MKIVQFENGKFGVRRGGYFTGYQFLDNTDYPVWRNKSCYNSEDMEFPTKEIAERQITVFIKKENDYQARVKSGQDIGKLVR